MIDPYLINNPTTPPQYKNLDAIGKLDLILVSHAHYDHFEDAVPLAKKNDVPMYGPAGLNQALLTLRVLPLRLVPRFSRDASTQGESARVLAFFLRGANRDGSTTSSVRK